MSEHEINHTARAVRARKQHWCSQSWVHDHVIRSGDRYVRSVIFPGHDAHGGGKASWVRVICA
jgi:hypothetical protein